MRWWPRISLNGAKAAGAGDRLDGNNAMHQSQNHLLLYMVEKQEKEIDGDGSFILILIIFKEIGER